MRQCYLSFPFLAIFFVNILLPGAITPAYCNVSKDETSSGAEQNKDDLAVQPGTKEMEDEKKKMRLAKLIPVAKVNGVEITMYSLIRTIYRFAPQYLGGKDEEAPSPELLAKIKTDALDWVIFEELAVQDAIRQGLKPSREEMNGLMAEVKKMFPTPEEYQKYLQDLDSTEDLYQQQLERLKLYEIIMERQVYAKLPAKPDEKAMMELYEKEKERFLIPEAIMLDDVFFTLKGDEKEMSVRAEKALNEIQQREDRDVWQLKQDGAFTVSKLSISQETHPELYKAVTSLGLGQLSKVIKERDGFHIIKVVQKKAAHQQTFEEVKKFLEQRVTIMTQEKRKQQWESELKKSAKVEIFLEEAEKALEKKQLSE